MHIQDWIERYIETESLFPDNQQKVNLTLFNVASPYDIEDATLFLRNRWNLDYDPIDDFVQLLKGRGIMVGLIDGFDNFDECTAIANSFSIIND